MISEMAMEDIEALRADGVEVTPRDIVRLNALGLKVERSERAASSFAMPRVAFLGRIPLREPTIAAEMWYIETEKVFDHGDMQTNLMLRGLSMSVPFENLPDPVDLDAVEAAIGEFKNRVAAYTPEQIRSAVLYALVGNDHVTGEDPPERRTDGRNDIDGIPMVVGVLRDGIVLKLGPIGELKRLRVSQLKALVAYAGELKFGKGSSKGEHADALAGYLCALDDIRERLKGTE